MQLQIKVTDDNEATPPNDIAVEGLDIRFTGQSQLIEGRNFHMSYSFVYSYTIMPLKAGTYTIPPQMVHTKNGNQRTPALTLNVAPNNGGATTRRGRRSGASGIDERKLVFAELIVPKNTAYVGEIVPVEIRLGFNTRARSRARGAAESNRPGLHHPAHAGAETKHGNNRRGRLRGAYL